jgi:hypothetical protein
VLDLAVVRGDQNDRCSHPYVDQIAIRPAHTFRHEPNTTKWFARAQSRSFARRHRRGSLQPSLTALCARSPRPAPWVPVWPPGVMVRMLAHLPARPELVTDLIATPGTGRSGATSEVSRRLRPLVEGGVVATTASLDAESLYSARGPAESEQLWTDRRAAYEYPARHSPASSAR